MWSDVRHAFELPHRVSLSNLEVSRRPVQPHCRDARGKSQERPDDGTHQNLIVEGIRRVSPVLLASGAGRSRHCCAAANNLDQALELYPRHLRNTLAMAIQFPVATL